MSDNTKPGSDNQISPASVNSKPALTNHSSQTAKSSTASSGQPLSRAAQLGIHFGFFVFFMVLLSAFGSFVNDMYQPSLPSMRRYFDCSVPMVQLGLTMGMIGLAVGQLILGPVSDKYGRKPIFFFGGGVFIVGAAVSIFSPTIHFFLICRFFQGVGASAGYFLARTIPADVYSGRQLAKTMAVIGAINGFAPACAPVFGGLLSDHFGWKSVFVALILFCILLICIAPHLKETLNPALRSRGDIWRSFANYGSLLRNRPFMIHCIFKGASLGLLFAYISSAPFIMQDRFGLSQTMFGIVMGANSLCAMAGSLLVLKFKPLKLGSLAGAILLAVAVGAECVSLFVLKDFWSYELLMLPIIFALGMIFTVSNTQAMDEGAAHAGDASAILGVTGYVFGAVAAPLVGMGDIMNSTAYVYLGLTAISLIFAIISYRLPVDASMKATDN